MRDLRAVGVCAVSIAVDMKQMESAERQRQLSLLLVDDDVELCGMMREFFTQEGHRLTAPTTAAKA